MATIELKKDELVVHMRGWDVILALRSTLTVALKDIKEVVADAEAIAKDVDAKLAGGHWPGKFTAGWFMTPDGIAFFDVHDPKKTICIYVEHHRYQKIVVEIDDETPEQCKERIQQALASYR